MKAEWRRRFVGHCACASIWRQTLHKCCKEGNLRGQSKGNNGIGSNSCNARRHGNGPAKRKRSGFKWGGNIAGQWQHVWRAAGHGVPGYKQHHAERRYRYEWWADFAFQLDGNAIEISSPSSSPASLQIRRDEQRNGEWKWNRDRDRKWERNRFNHNHSAVGTGLDIRTKRRGYFPIAALFLPPETAGRPASLRARAKTARSMGAVSNPVFVFCRDG